MDLLETILRTSNAEQHLDNFHAHKIDAFTLKVLGDEDLKILGIEDPDTRKSILTKAGNLQIPSEKHVDLTVDKAYVLLVLQQMSMQIRRHLAAVSIVLGRPDVVVCDMKLAPSARCLAKCVASLDRQILTFDTRLGRSESRKTVKMFVVLPLLTASVTLASFVLYKFVTTS